jgi:hypothetical protein
MQSEWEFSRSSGHCATSGRVLAEGEAYYAVLFETPQGFERRDYASDAWAGPPEGHFCYWRARVPLRNRPSGPLPVDHALLTQLFLKLEEKESEVRQQFRFVLALLLMRKRILRLEKAECENEQEYWVLRLVTEQSEHRVLNPRLGEEEIERLSRQLTAILSGDAQAIESLESVEPPPAPEASPDTAAAGSATGAEDGDDAAREVPA